MNTNMAAPTPAQPIQPSEAQGAQIPLQTFHIPDFPPDARGLKALTLTSDIKLDEYQSLVLPSSDGDDAKPAAYTVPASLPASIESLTLELFSLGYPAGFLAALARALPNLKSIVVYSQLFAGISAGSQADAVDFFRFARGLRAVHFLDVFARPGFFEAAAPWLRWSASEVEGEARRGLMFLEVNYTFRHEDEEFMGKIQAAELPALIGPGLISCSFNVATPDEAGDDEQDPTNIRDVAGKEGVMAFNKTLVGGVVERLVDVEGGSCPKGLRALNLTLYTLTVEQLKAVLGKCKGVMVLNVTVEIEPGEEVKRGLLGVLEGCKELEQVEIVANPSLKFFMEVRTKSLLDHRALPARHSY